MKKKERKKELKKSRGLVFKFKFCVGVTHPSFKWLLCLVKRDH